MTDKNTDKSAASDRAAPATEKSFMELVTDWERGFDSFANQFMGTETYSAWMNQMQKTRLQAQQSFGDMVSQQLVALNVPSRDDVVRLAENVRKMDRRLERIEAAINRLVPEEPQAPTKRPKRTKKPSFKADQSSAQNNAQKNSDKSGHKKTVKKSAKKSSAERK